MGNDLDADAEYDALGNSVGMSADGKRAIARALGNDENGIVAEHANIYEEKHGTWTQVGKDLDGEAADHGSGYSVGMSADGRRAIVGAPFNGGNEYQAGHVRIYEAYLAESLDGFPSKFLSIIGPVVGVIFILFRFIGSILLNMENQARYFLSLFSRSHPNNKSIFKDSL